MDIDPQQVHQRLPIKRKASDYFTKCEISAAQLIQVQPASIVATAGFNQDTLRSVSQFADLLKTAANKTLDAVGTMDLGCVLLIPERGVLTVYNSNYSETTPRDRCELPGGGLGLRIELNDGRSVCFRPLEQRHVALAHALEQQSNNKC